MNECIEGGGRGGREQTLLSAHVPRRTYNLGQNKKEQLAKGKEPKTRHFGITEMGGGVVQMFHNPKN